MPPAPNIHRCRRGVAPLAATAAAVAFVGASRYLTPWPMAMVIRRVFERGGAQSAAGMLPHVPDGVTGRLDLPSATGARHDRDTRFDVFRPDSATGPLPTVVWIHGGGWVAGHKSDVAPYLKVLAAQGFTTVGLDYTRGPEAHYPTAVRQLNQALAHLIERADDYGIDPTSIVLAGDSAGAQLASQLTTMITNPTYAGQVGIAPALRPEQLAGVILNCGVYDLDMMSRATGLVGWGFKKALWAYTGSRHWATTPAGTQMSTLRFVTRDFPPTYLSGGNGDGLTTGQSIPLAERLRTLGVPVSALFFDDDHQPPQQHEYQFALGTAEADEALTATLTFLKTLPGFGSG